MGFKSLINTVSLGLKKKVLTTYDNKTNDMSIRIVRTKYYYTLTLLYLIVGREIYIRSEKDIILICDIVTGCTFVDKR